MYDENDLAVIRKMAALVEAGLSASDAAEAAKSGDSPTPPPLLQRDHPLVPTLLGAAEEYDEQTFLATMAGAIDELGWASALDEVFFPTLRKLGARWETASLPPAKEHFASELVRRRMASALDALGPSTPDKPKILMACPESERHDLGLLALALLLRSSGANVIYLGADVPTSDIIEAVELLKPDAVCLSATSAEGLASLVRATRTILSKRLPQLFIGGPAISTTGTAAAGVILPSSLELAATAILERTSQQQR
jgi:methanogenic corrinoid protein MtbC1